MAIQIAMKPQGRAVPDGKGGKYLTFSLAQEDYGIGILKVKEIIGVMPITSLPQVPQFVKGVINLRGKVIPIFDLRLRFGLAEEEHTDKTCIIVVEVAGSTGQIQMGIVVDSVSEVMNIKPDHIEKAPSFGDGLDRGYIRGMAKVDGQVKIILDIDQVMGAGEISMERTMETSGSMLADGGQ